MTDHPVEQTLRILFSGVNGIHKLKMVEVRKIYGSWSRINRALDELGYNVPNTSAVERFNGTARRMNAHQVRRSLAFPIKLQLVKRWHGGVSRYTTGCDPIEA